MPDGAALAPGFLADVAAALCPFEASSVIRVSVCMVSFLPRWGLPESGGNPTRCDSGVCSIARLPEEDPGSACYALLRLRIDCGAMCATARTSSRWPGKGGRLNPRLPHEHPRLPSDCSTDSAWSAGAVIRASGPFSWRRCARSPRQRQKGRILFLVDRDV